ncbi:hypothetical protein ACFOWE_05270, partial [Planomonospora corallina]
RPAARPGAEWTAGTGVDGRRARGTGDGLPGDGGARVPSTGMRTVRFESPFYNVTDDPDRVIGDFLGFALSLKNISGRPPAEEFADIFSPEGDGMRLPDTFVAYRAEVPDDVPEEFDDRFTEEIGRKELWVLTRLEFRKMSVSAVIEGPELRHLLHEALAQRTAAREARRGPS